MYMQKVSWRFQKFAPYTRSLKIYAIIVVYGVSLIGPLQPVINVIQNRHAGERKKHWGKTNKELILFKMVKKIKRLLPVLCSGSSHVHFMNVAVQLANWWHMILARVYFIFSSLPPPCLARVALCAKCRVRLAWLIKSLLCRLGSVVFFLKRELCFYALLYMGLEPKKWSIKRYLVLSLTLALFLCYAFDGNDVKLVCHK